MSLIRVEFAVYGALPNGDQNDAQGAIVTHRLQTLIDSQGGVVTINNTSFGDPVVDFKKHFAAIVFRDEDNSPVRCFACEEGQTINFNVEGGTTQE